jgi:hypothetical protein
MPLMLPFFFGLIVYLCFLGARSLVRVYDQKTGATANVARFVTYTVLSCYLLTIHTGLRFPDPEIARNHLFGYSPDTLYLFGPFAVASAVLIATGRTRLRPNPRAGLSVLALWLALILQFVLHIVTI